MIVPASKHVTEFWKLGVDSLKELEVERGITASGRDEVYGCIFGRDSLITSLMLLSYMRQSGERSHVPLIKKILTNLAQLQGVAINIESGEEPGKCIHEYRTDRHEHLTQSAEPWYLYPDGTMRNYDTADATLLFLMAFHELYTLTGDFLYIERHLPNIRAALQWIFDHGDVNGDGFFDYRFHPERKFGGLKTQSWMDSTESVFFENSNERPGYPIAPVEVQAYAFAALRNFADFYSAREPEFSKKLSARASNLKISFNRYFVRRNGRRTVEVAYALDGVDSPLTSARSSMGHCLWACYRGGAIAESILDDALIPGVVRRLMQPDLFVPDAGIRTLSTRSIRFDPVSYHNGSIWPHDTAIVAEGFENFGYTDEARLVRAGLMNAYQHFNTPIELFGYSEGFKEYRGDNGGTACRVQAWSAASLLTTLHGLDL